MNVNGLFNKCRRHQASLSLLAAGALDASERAALEMHLAGCPACRAKLAQMQHLTRGLTEAGRRFAELEAPVSLRRRWMTEVRGSAGARDAVPMPLILAWLSGRRLAWGSLAAMWMLVLLLRVSAPDLTRPAMLASAPPTSWREVYAALRVDKPVPSHRADAGRPAPSRQTPPSPLPPRSQRPGAQSTTHSPIA
jgi:anti-sigma factor RsiW